MTLAITVFGVSSETLTPTLCYVLLRVVRGAGRYPPPTLPKDSSRIPPISKFAIRGTPLQLLAWDFAIPEEDENAIIAKFNTGEFTIPTVCPIAGGVQLHGAQFGPVIVEEDTQRVSVSGSGLLYRKGLALDGPLQNLKSSLSDLLPPGTMPASVKAIVKKIESFSGIKGALKTRLSIGTADFFYRAFPPALNEGPLFNVTADKSDIRKPMLKVHIHRHAAPVDQFFRLVIQLKNYNYILSVKVIDIASGVLEVIADAPAHITDVSFSVFDDKGLIVDFQSVQFLQSIDLGLSVSSGSDVLPPAFAGAPSSPDIENRPRITTSTFGLPTEKGLSGGLEVLRNADKFLEDIIGKQNAVPENVWFERGADGQVEVIRWIKSKVEKPAIAKAYLVDPYLGSAALQRTIARQGNESIDLKILVSPGNIDPDAEDVDASSGGRFLDTLIKTATAWADKLAGSIEIVHIKRGTGARQAFHDRYLCTVTQSGIPTVYLLSNSLSKAAGDWPFAISELDRVTGWRVYSYIQEMLDGRIAGTKPEILWQRDGGKGAVPAAMPPASQIDQEPDWAAPTRALLTNVYAVITRNTAFEESLAALFEAFLAHPPEGIDYTRFAHGLYDVVDHRVKIVVFTIDYFRQHGHADVANLLEEKFVEDTLQHVPEPGEKKNWHINFEERALILKALGIAIAHKADATTFVRDELNPRVHALVSAVETQRLGDTLPWEAQEAALFLCVVALEVAASSGASVKFRAGLATDYIHWVGRLARSDQSRIYDRPKPAEYKQDIELAGTQIIRAHLVLGPVLCAPIQRVLDDPLVSRTLKVILSSVPPAE